MCSLIIIPLNRFRSERLKNVICRHLTSGNPPVEQERLPGIIEIATEDTKIEANGNYTTPLFWGKTIKINKEFIGK